MANITRYSPIEELFNDFGKGFWVKPLGAQGAKAEYKDGVLNLTLPKKAGASAKRVSVA